VAYGCSQGGVVHGCYTIVGKAADVDPNLALRYVLLSGLLETSAGTSRRESGV
jgi:hypothetical protein